RRIDDRHPVDCDGGRTERVRRREEHSRHANRERHADGLHVRLPAAAEAEEPPPEHRAEAWGYGHHSVTAASATRIAATLCVGLLMPSRASAQDGARPPLRPYELFGQRAR